MPLRLSQSDGHALGRGGMFLRRSVVNDVQALVAALGGNSVVAGLYDTRYGITATTTVSQWDDARGASGFGPSLVQATGGSQPAWDSTNKIVGTTGSKFMETALSSLWPLNAGLWIAYVGTIGKAATVYPVMIQDLAASPTRYLGFLGNGANIQMVGSGYAVTSPVAKGATRRLSFSYITQPGAVVTNQSFNNPYSHVLVDGRAGKFANVPFQAGGTNYLSIGKANGLFSPEDYRAIIVGTGPLTVAKVAAIKAWAAANHSHVPDATKTKLGCFHGDSLTAGVGTGVTVGTNDYPSVVMAQAGMSGYDGINVGVSGLFAWNANEVDYHRVDPYAGFGQTKKLLVSWIGTNDLHSGISAATVINNLKTLSADRRAAGWLKLAILAPIPRGDNGAALITESIAVHDWVRDHAVQDGYFDVLCPVHLNPLFNDFTQTTGSFSNATYYQADLVHLTVAGYAEIANNATYGVYPALVAAGVL